MDDTAGEKVSGPRPPSFLDALIPVVVLIVLLTLTIVLFGVDAANGPLQVALLTSAMVAGLVAFKNGYTAAAYMAGVLGVPTVQYLPYAFFNMLNPLVAVVYAFTGFHIEHLVRAEVPTVVDGPVTSDDDWQLLVIPEGDGHVE